MNAICGFLRHDGAIHAQSGDGLDAMLAAFGGHREDGARWTEGMAGLGCRRLPAFAAGEDRPEAALRFDRDAGLVLAADARLDDRGALCAALGVPGAERPGLTDSDLILRAYVRWGRDCPNHLLGDYAFAVWDARHRRLFCARDPVGVRPFYYARTPDRFLFASSVEAVLAAPGVSCALDEATVAAFLIRIGFWSPDRTFFRAVRKLPPGHALTIDDGATRLDRYWRPEQTPEARPATDQVHAEAFLDLFSRAVKDRLRGADPVGVHLSGGLDSSSVAVLAARELRRQGRPPPLAFSWLPELGGRPPREDHAREYALVDAVCEQEGLQVFHRSPGPEDVIAVLRHDVVRPGVHIHMNEEVVQRCAAQRGVRVLLSGWGGDEAVSCKGRGYYEDLLLRGHWARLCAEYRARGKGLRSFLAEVLLPLVHPDLPRSLRRLRRGKDPRRRRWLIDPAFARRAKPLPETILRPFSVRYLQLRLLRSGHLGERMEGWAASGARRGIEYRYPLLDRRLLEFALGLPPEQFRRGRWNRWLMRHALGAALRGAPPGTSADGPVLPPEICWNRSKADLARVDAALDAFAEALPVLRRELRRRAPARACYVDMPRLLDGLDADLLAMLSPESWLDAGSPYTDQLLLNRYFAGRQTLVSSTYNYLLGSARAIRARERASTPGAPRCCISTCASNPG